MQKTDFRKTLYIALLLANLMPVLFSLYIFNYMRNNLMSSTEAMISGIILFTGWLLILNISLLYVLNIHKKSRSTLKELGDNKILGEIYLKDEVEGLESVFTLLSTKVKTSFEELKLMSTKIETLNWELAKKVGVLLTIMQIHEIFSQGVQEKDIFQVILNKLKETLNLKKISLVLIKESKELSDYIVFPGEEDLPLSTKHLKNISRLKNLLVLDNNANDENFSFLKDLLVLRNIFINPLHMGGNLKGFLIGGNQLDSFHFSREDMDLIEILSKNIVLIWEHKRLSRAVENLEIYDPLTGLYNKKHIEKRLGEEIKRATTYQRPCGILLIEATNLKDFQDKFGTIEAEKTLKKLAKLFKDTLRPIDMAARIDENKLLAILIERNKRQCLQIGESIKNAFDSYFKKENLSINFVFSVAENPLDGASAQELLEYASTGLQKQ